MSIRFAFVLALLFVATAGWTNNLSLLAVDQLAHCGSEDCGDHDDDEEAELLADCGEDHGDDDDEAELLADCGEEHGDDEGEGDDGSETKLAHCGSEDCGDHDDDEEAELLADCGEDHGDDDDEAELLA